jgi:hypothetical protein
LIDSGFEKVFFSTNSRIKFPALSNSKIQPKTSSAIKTLSFIIAIPVGAFRPSKSLFLFPKKKIYRYNKVRALLFSCL